ncbi:unnamed protein product [Euphydryas editha]|uniref:DNA-directed DNA polymerase n=1 Tax=Euphydryas editha TaxID=104508 RepID=A0AAU9US99_EUPED|nr:unnamed protein product [Euphydryas editha]
MESGGGGGGDNVYVGQMVTSYAEMRSLPDYTNLILVTSDSNSFIQNFIPYSLNCRRNDKKELESIKKLATRDYDRERFLHGKQLSKKIDVNSLYGTFGNSFPPVSAATTLFGRKIIVCGMTVMHTLMLKLILTIQRDDDRIAADYDYCPIMRENTKRLLGLRQISLSDIEHIDDILEYVENACQLHGLDDVARIKKNTSTMMRIERRVNDFAGAIDRFNRLLDTWNISVNRTVIDFDTDGFQIANSFQLDTVYLYRQFIRQMQTILIMPNLGFEEKINKVLLIIARKKYTILQSGPLVTTPETMEYYRNSWIDVGDFAHFPQRLRAQRSRTDQVHL